jgi:hypothetical protein
MKVNRFTLAILIAGAVLGSEAAAQNRPSMRLQQAIGTVPLTGPVPSLFVLNGARRHTCGR